MVLKIFKEAEVISALMKVYSIPFHDRGHINVMLWLQSCTDSLQVLAGPSSEWFPASSDGACNFSNTGVEEDISIIEESFIAFYEEGPVRIKQEEIVEDKTFLDLKSEPDKVSCVCICMLLDTFYLCPEMLVFFFFVTSVYLAN
jgi:hypothetical protein